MSLSKIRELREKIAKLNEDCQPLRRTIADKTKSADEVRTAKASLDKILDDIEKLVTERDTLSQDIEREARADAADRDVRGTQRLPEGRIAPGDRAGAVAQFNRALKRSASTEGAMKLVSSDVRAVYEEMNENFWKALQRYSMAVAMGDAGIATSEDRALVFGQNQEYREFLCGGFNLDEKEKRDMGIGTNALGGYFVPRGFVYDIEEALKYYGDMLNLAEILDTATGQPLPYPTDNDTTNTGEIVGEGKQVSAQDVAIGQILYGAYKFSTKMVKVSLELLQDSAFDLEPYLKKKFAIRLGRILNTKFTIGVGTTEPLGILTAVVANNGAAQLAAAYGVGLLAAGAAANDGGAETGRSSITSSDLTNLEHCVDPLYRRNAKYMFHDQTLRFLKTLLDKYGRPLWKQGVAAGSPDLINSYPYSINNDMPTIALNAKTVLFGDHKKYLIRRVKELGVLTLRERFADYGQVAYIGFARYDGNLLDAGTHPLSYLQQAAA